MHVSPKTFLWISLAAHVAVGAAVYRGARHATVPAPASARETEPVLAGDTFEVPEELPAPAPESTPDPAGDLERNTPSTRPSPPSPSSHGTRGESARGLTGGGASAAGSVFGATGDRASVDRTAFTRGFPQAASADPAWAVAPFGSAGDAFVQLEIDESGALVSARVEGSPGAALRAGIARTIALLRARSFTASRPVTRLHLAARVSHDEVHDGLHGEVFAVGGSFEKDEGDAFFALAIGRRVDLTVRQARMER